MQIWRAASRHIVLTAVIALANVGAFFPAMAADEGNDLAPAIELYQEVAKLTSQGQFQHAIPLAGNALSIQEKALGPDHRSVAQGLTLLATLYFKLGRNAEAEPLYKRSLEMLEKTHGPEDPAIANALDSLEQIYV